MLDQYTPIIIHRPILHAIDLHSELAEASLINWRTEATKISLSSTIISIRG